MSPSVRSTAVVPHRAGTAAAAARRLRTTALAVLLNMSPPFWGWISCWTDGHLYPPASRAGTEISAGSCLNVDSAMWTIWGAEPGARTSHARHRSKDHEPPLRGHRRDPSRPRGGPGAARHGGGGEGGAGEERPDRDHPAGRGRPRAFPGGAAGAAARAGLQSAATITRSIWRSEPRRKSWLPTSRNPCFS